MYCNESYVPHLPDTRETVSWLYDVITIPDMHFENFGNISDYEQYDEDNEKLHPDGLGTDSAFDKIIYLKVSSRVCIEELKFSFMQTII